jgi:anti-sigma factor RsiW
MSCQEIQTLLHGHVDGELDLLRSLEMNQHLQECAACPHSTVARPGTLSGLSRLFEELQRRRAGLVLLQT